MPVSEKAEAQLVQTKPDNRQQYKYMNLGFLHSFLSLTRPSLSPSADRAPTREPLPLPTSPLRVTLLPTSPLSSASEWMRRSLSGHLPPSLSLSREDEALLWCSAARDRRASGARLVRGRIRRRRGRIRWWRGAPGGEHGAWRRGAPGDATDHLHQLRADPHVAASPAMTGRAAVVRIR